MRQRHRRTLEAIFRRPVPGGLLWADIESLLLACGAEIQERAGSRVRIKPNGKRAVFHRPHPRPVTSKGAVRRCGSSCQWPESTPLAERIRSMEYQGYRAIVTFDDELDIFHGAVIGTTSVISFEGESVEELRQALAGAVDEYLAFCEEEGVAPDKPFSGNVALRMSPELHRAATEAAQVAGQSLNAWVTERVAEAVATPSRSR